MDKLWKYAEKGNGGHDIDHIKRVYHWAERIAEEEQGEIDRQTLFSSVILHDIAREDEDLDKSGKTDHALLGAVRAYDILLSEGYPQKLAELVRECIRTHRYSSDSSPPDSLVAKILFDADKLDGLGYVGVARLFMLAGQYGERLYVEPPEGFGDGARVFRISDLSEYSANLEFIGKMRFVPERLLTEAGKRFAMQLMPPMESFFAGLQREINDFQFPRREKNNQ